MAKDGKPQLVDIPSPLSGLSTNYAFSEQPKQSTPACLNVRPFDCTTGRRRLSRRPGLEKYISSQFSSASVQDINSMIISATSLAGTAGFITTASSQSKVRIYDTSGSVRLTSATLYSTRNSGCYDVDNVSYVVSWEISGYSFTVYSYGTDAVLRWTSSVITAGSSQAVCGFAVAGGIIYVFVSSTSVSAIYRLNAADGSAVDGGPWMTNGDGLVVVKSSTPQAKLLAAWSGAIGVVGKSGSSIILQQINPDTKAITATTTSTGLSYSTFMQGIVTVDFGGNFYVATFTSNGTDNDYTLKKITSAGAVSWTVGPGTNTAPAASNVYDLSYDNSLFSLGIVGTNLFGTTDSFQYYNATTGAKTGGGKPATLVEYDACAADGSGNFWLKDSVNPNGVVMITPVSSIATAVHTVASGTAAINAWIASTNASPTSVDPSQSERFARYLLVCGGGLYRFDSGTKSTVAATFASSLSLVVLSTQVGVLMIYCDGASYLTYNGSTNVTGTLAATAGSLPTDANGRKAKICETWRSRLILTAMDSEPQNVFASAQDDPTDFDYSPASPSATQAWSFNVDNGNGVGDIVNGFCPMGEDVAIVGCNHSIHRIIGDPADGGSIKEVTRKIGMAFGRAWCRDPQGNLYFFSSSGSVWRMASMGDPQRLSLAIDTTELFDLDLSELTTRLVWDDKWRGLHVYISPKDAADDAVHYWWDADTDQKNTFQIVKTPGSWWPDSFDNPNQNAVAVYMLDGDAPGERRVLMGTRDGYVLVWDNDADSNDNGRPVASYVDIGPIHNGGFSFTISDLQAVMGAESEDVNYAIKSAECIEAAQTANLQQAGTFTSGRNRSQAVRKTDHAMFVRLSGTGGVWSLEDLKGVFSVSPGGVAQRSF